MSTSATLFPTITGADWKRSIARARADGNPIIQQIRAKCAPTTSRTVEQRLDRHPHKVEGPGFDSPAVHPISSGSPTWAGLAMTHETSNGAKECRKALTRQVISEVVRRCETPRANDCPPLETLPRREEPRDVEEQGQRGGVQSAAATARLTHSTGSHPTKQANLERAHEAKERAATLPHVEDKSRAADQDFEASPAAREHFQNPQPATT